MSDSHRLDTRLVHAGEPRPGSPLPGSDRAVLLPLYQNATFEYAGGDSPEALRYTRLGNTPNQMAVGTKLAAIEGAAAGLVTASGMAAISTALLAVVPPGGHLIAQRSLYGGTLQFLQQDFEGLGRSFTLVDADRSDADRLDVWKSAIRPETRAVYVESISNPVLQIPDLPAIAAWARSRGLVSLIDNTFPSPVNLNPISLGYDLVLHSATKYLNGHSDVIAGAVVGSEELISRITKLMTHLGGSLDPHSCFLLSRGMKTLGLRVRQHNATALALARALEGHRKVRWVRYPGLESHPDHARAKALLRGFGGMLCFEYDGTAGETDAMLRRLELPFIAPSLGGPESLVTRPAITSHSWISPSDRLALGISDSLVRVSVGLEDAADLVADFEAAL